MIKRIFVSAIFLVIVLSMHAQKGTIKGRIYNEKNNEPVPFANVIIFGTTIGSTSDLDGNFIFTGLQPGFVQLAATSVGFEQKITPDFEVTNSKVIFIDIPMTELSVELEEVVIKASPFTKTAESPLSVRTLQISEIEKNPGGNRDISRVVQSLPGVSSTPAFRNDLIVRGGGPNENSFYLDDIEIPNINHFSTQGASGGPVGIINADLIRQVDFYTGAFPADRGRALSSFMELKLIEGNPDKIGFKGTVGATDLGVALNGPIGEKSTFVVSYRRSYLQFLFDVIGLPFLPTYNDLLLKYKVRLDQRNEITFIGLGAIDKFKLNTGLENPDEGQALLLNSIPVNEQWSYTAGAVYKRFREKGFDAFIISRNFLNNKAYKYYENIEVDSLLIFDYSSTEAENKFRYEHNGKAGRYNFVFGGGLEYAQYTNYTFQRIFQDGESTVKNYDSDLNLFNWNLFGETNRLFLNDRLTASLGVRMDASAYDPKMSNPLNQFSPRLSLSYALAEKWSLNLNTGRYYQRPPYTALGFRDNNNVLVNKDNNISYIRADHIVAGIEYSTSPDSKITAEGFYKIYDNYPFSVNDSINIASKGADFGTYGDEEVISISKGRAYGFELFARAKDVFGFNTILSYTFVRSEFTDKNDNYVASSWDNRHILNLTVLRQFKKNWDAGLKWRYVGGAPYTPADLMTSSKRPAWDVRQSVYPDYNRFNQSRLQAFHQLDIRVDKAFYFNKWSLTLYVDIQNVYNFQASNTPSYTNLTPEGTPNITNPGASYEDQIYDLRVIETESGTILPTIGIIIEI